MGGAEANLTLLVTKGATTYSTKPIACRVAKFPLMRLADAPVGGKDFGSLRDSRVSKTPEV
jgi:hypothetical protein